QIQTKQGPIGTAVAEALETYHGNVKGVTVTTMADVAEARDAALAFNGPKPSGSLPPAPAGELPIEGPSVGPASATGKLNLSEVVGHPATGLIVTAILKNFTQPIAEKIVNEVSTYETNRMLADVGAPPMTAEEASKLTPQHQAFVNATLAGMPPGADIGMAGLSILAAGITDVIAKPWMTEFYQQYKTPADFFRIYGQ